MPALATPSRFPPQRGGRSAQDSQGPNRYLRRPPARPPVNQNQPFRRGAWIKPPVQFGRKPPLPVPPPLSPGRPPFRVPFRFLGRAIPFFGWALLAYELWRLYEQYSSYFGPPAGWRIGCSVNWGPLEAFSHGAPNICGTPGQVYVGPMPPTYVWSCGAFTCGFHDIAMGPYTNAGLRFGHAIEWVAPRFPKFGPGSYPSAPPAPSNYQPAPEPDIPPAVPDIYPELDPFRRPMSPAPQPRPLPVRFPKFPRPPDRSPDEWHKRGPNRPTRARPNPNERPGPVEIPARPPAFDPPFVDRSTDPSGQPRPVVNNPPFSRGPVNEPNPKNDKPPLVVFRPNGSGSKPPAPNEKEKKWSAKVGPSWLARIFGEATEAKDIIDAFYQSLPKDVRKKYKRNPPPQDALRALYDHAEQIDLQRAIELLAINAIEDSVVGGIIGRAQRAAIKRGINPGAIGGYLR